MSAKPIDINALTKASTELERTTLRARELANQKDSTNLEESRNYFLGVMLEHVNALIDMINASSSEKVAQELRTEFMRVIEQYKGANITSVSDLTNWVERFFLPLSDKAMQIRECIRATLQRLQASRIR